MSYTQCCPGSILGLGIISGFKVCLFSAKRDFLWVLLSLSLSLLLSLSLSLSLLLSLPLSLPLSLLLLLLLLYYDYYYLNIT